MGIPMKYFYLILPIAFAAMTLRIIQNNYLRFVKKIEIIDPEAKALEDIKNGTEAGANNQANGEK